MRKLEDILDIQGSFNIVGRGLVIAGSLREDFNGRPLLNEVIEWQGRPHTITAIERNCSMRPYGAGSKVGFVLRAVKP